MMQRVMYTGSEAILTAFDSMSEDTPYYSVWIGKSIMASDNTGDIEKGRRKVEQMIIACEQSGNTEAITIKFHPGPDKQGFITDKTPVVSSMIVRACSIEGNADQLERLNNTQYSFMLNSITKAIDDKILPLQEKILLLESGIEDDEDTGIIGSINKCAPLLQNPVIMGFVERIMGVIMPSQTKPVMLSGIPGTIPAEDNNNIQHVEPQLLTDDQLTKLNDSLNKLAAHCDLVTDISLLAQLAENNPTMFKFLLQNLRTQ